MSVLHSILSRSGPQSLATGSLNPSHCPGHISPARTQAARQARHSHQAGPRRHAQVLQPVRITNTSSEVYAAQGVSQDDIDNKIVLDPNYQVHNPELGPLSKRVNRYYLDSLLDNEIDHEETAYWFSTPPEGWNNEVQQLEPAEEAPVTFPEPYHEDAEDGYRIPFEDLVEGQVITGLITDIWLYHGAQIDIGAEFDGLITINEHEWLEGGQPSEEELAKLEEAAVQEGHEARMEAILEALSELDPARLELMSEAIANKAEDILKEVNERVATIENPDKAPLVEAFGPEPVDMDAVYLTLEEMLDKQAVAVIREKSDLAFQEAVKKYQPMTVIESFLPGDKVEVRVHRLRQPGLYRWPVQLAVVKPEIQEMIMDPDEYQPSINHAWAEENGWTMDDILDATGRTYETVQYFLPRDDDEMTERIQKSYGWESPDTGHYDHNPLEHAWLTENQQLIADTAAANMP